MLNILFILIIAAICGAVAGAITGAKPLGCLANIGVGLIGSVVGYFIRQMFFPNSMGFNIGGTSFPILWALIGSIVFLLIMQLIVNRGRSRTI